MGIHSVMALLVLAVAGVCNFGKLLSWNIFCLPNSGNYPNRQWRRISGKLTFEEKHHWPNGATSNLNICLLYTSDAADDTPC
eukprot:6218840-Amphidinium_carterae.1